MTSKQALGLTMNELAEANAEHVTTISKLEQKLTDMAVQLANAESKYMELAEFKSRVYAQMGAGCEAPEFSITEGLSNLRRFADTLHAIEREFFTKEVPDEECEGETVDECPLCWGMTVEQYVSVFGKCLDEVRAQGVEEFLRGSQLPYQIATVLADYDNVDDATLQTVIWSGQPPEPDGDVWHLEYVSRGNAIVHAVLKELRKGVQS